MDVTDVDVLNKLKDCIAKYAMSYQKDASKTRLYTTRNKARCVVSFFEKDLSVLIVFMEQQRIKIDQNMHFERNADDYEN